MPGKLILGVADYAVIALVLVISAGIGIYFRITGGRQKTNEEFLLARKDSSMFPVCLSLVVSYLSVNILMGLPAEIYLYGTSMAFMTVGSLLGPIIASFLFLPIYFSSGVSTAFQYLEKRFGTSTRIILSGIFVFLHILLNGVLLYAPALALSVVSNLSLWSSVITVGVVCTFCCTLGGLKAVLWTDAFQAVLMYIALLTIIIKGCIDLGGIQNIYDSAYEGGRVIVPTLEMNFSVQYTMWNVVLFGLIMTTESYGASQLQVQRLLTLKSFKQAAIVCIISAPMLVIFQLLCCLAGLIFYVYFKSCDPVSSPEKPIFSPDQLMPYYISLTMRQYPGLPGLCISGIFSATLSSMSSHLNCMSTVTYIDIMRSIWPNLSRPVLTAKCINIFFGALAIFMTYVISSMGNIIQATVLLVGIVTAPLFTVFFLGSCTTAANELGTNIGILTGLLLAACLTFIPNKRHYPELPVGTNCSESSEYIPNFNASYVNPFLSVNSTDTTSNTFHADNFPMSHMWIAPLVLMYTITVGYIASLIASCIRGKTKPVPLELLSPVRQWFCKNQQKEDRKESLMDIASVEMRMKRF